MTAGGVRSVKPWQKYRARKKALLAALKHSDRDLSVTERFKLDAYEYSKPKGKPAEVLWTESGWMA